MLTQSKGTIDMHALARDIIHASILTNEDVRQVRSCVDIFWQPQANGYGAYAERIREEREGSLVSVLP